MQNGTHTSMQPYIHTYVIRPLIHHASITSTQTSIHHPYTHTSFIHASYIHTSTHHTSIHPYSHTGPPIHTQLYTGQAYTQWDSFIAPEKVAVKEPRWLFQKIRSCTASIIHRFAYLLWRGGDHTNTPSLFQPERFFFLPPFPYEKRRDEQKKRKKKKKKKKKKKAG